jgi:hypothetical protein
VSRVAAALRRWWNREPVDLDVLDGVYANGRWVPGFDLVDPTPPPKFTPYPGYPKPPSPQDFAPPTEEQDPDDECFGVSGRPYQYGRCDMCGKPDGPEHACRAERDDQGRRLFHITCTGRDGKPMRVGSLTADDGLAVTLEVNGVQLVGVDFFYADDECGGRSEGVDADDEPERVILGTWTDLHGGEDWYRLREIALDEDLVLDHPLGADHSPEDHDEYTDTDCKVCGFEWSDPPPEGDA